MTHKTENGCPECAARRKAHREASSKGGRAKVKKGFSNAAVRKKAEATRRANEQARRVEAVPSNGVVGQEASDAT
jgi:hypothetical protein